MNINIRILALAALFVSGGMFKAMAMEAEQKNTASIEVQAKEAKDTVTSLEQQLIKLKNAQNGITPAHRSIAASAKIELEALAKTEGAKFAPSLGRKIRSLIQTAEKLANSTLADTALPQSARTLFQ